MRRLFFAQTLVLILVGVLHITGLYYYLQWYYWWYDLVLHFLGGLWVALAITWLWLALSRKVRIVPILLAVLVVGGAWELFEYVIGSLREGNYFFDTSLDMLMDALGGLCGYLLVHVAMLEKNDATIAP